MTQRRFLMACMQYPVGTGQSYMTTELADALVARGHEVTALVIDWQAPTGTTPTRMVTPGGVTVIRCAPRAIDWGGGMVRAASKFVLSGRHVAQTARAMIDLTRFDVMLAWMPAVAIAPLLPLVERAGVGHRLLFIWDFFPDHHREIGRIPGGLLFLVARTWERRLLRRFSTIFCTLPGNADYLRAHHRLEPDQRVIVTPIWSETAAPPPVDRAAQRSRHGLPPDRPIAVFGGQMIEGRGFDQMLDAADAADAAGSPLVFLFVGDGRLAPMVCDRARHRDNVRYLPAMPRAAYLELLGACDVGMVATVPGVTSFAIPSKTVDYLRARLPVIAAVEHGSDFAAMLERYGVGRSVPFGRPDLFQREATRLATDPRLRERVRTAAPRCLDERFDVRHAVAAIERAIGDCATARHVSPSAICRGRSAVDPA